MDEDLPPPETSVVLDEGRPRCELVVYVLKDGRVKDVRLRGPLRESRREALKDCVELRKAAEKGGGDPTLHKVREKRQDLETTTWTEKDLGGRQLDGAEGRAKVQPRSDQVVKQAMAEAREAARAASAPVGGPVDIVARISELAQTHGLDESSAIKLTGAFHDRQKLGCNLHKDFLELNQHLAASNRPSALVSMKLAEFRTGKAIGPCHYSGGRKDAGAARGLVVRKLAVEEMQSQTVEPAFKPVGPNWTKPGNLCRLPEEAGDWLIHERQMPDGKYRPWLFFNGDTGRYYQEKDSGDGHIEVGVPHDPKKHALSVKASSASLPSEVGKKLDMAVLLPELHKTGAILKQPLEFLDRPASLFLLCDGLRNTGAASEFCARKFHTFVLPRLGARATEWEDFELADILREAAEGLDGMLLASPSRFAGCGLAVALLSGNRLVVGTLGATRCLLCMPPAQAPERRLRAAVPEWTARLLAGDDVHTPANKDERMRIASMGDRILGQGAAGAVLHPRSASQASLEAAADDQQREFLRVAQATNSFAALGLTSTDLQEGSVAVRRVFRKRSLAVHPDKASEAMQAFAVAAFAKLEAATKVVEAMLQTDASAAALVAELFAQQDRDWLEADPSVAASFLGVPEGSSVAAVQEAVRQRFHGPLSQLQEICPKEIAQALKILEAAEASVVRGAPALWMPAEADVAVAVTRALGCGDLKAPVPLLSTGLATQVVALEPGSRCALALLADGARGLSDAKVAALLQRQKGRPRAAALQLALAAGSGGCGTSGEAVGTVCAYLDLDGPSEADGAMPEAKRAKTETTKRVRVSHVLLRWAGLKGADREERPGFPPPKRSQAEAEQELLGLMEELIAGDPKTRGARFKAAVLKHSECSSALNVPHADLGWVAVGEADPSLEAAAFATALGDISDIVVTPRGAHLLYRLA